MTKNRRHDIVKPSKYKTSMCTFFRSEEGCPFGEKCAFAHGEDELRPEPKDTAPLPAAATGEAVMAAAATLSTSESPRSEYFDTRAALGDGQHSDAPAQPLQHDPSTSMPTTIAGAKRRTKKCSLDLSSASTENAHGFPGGGPGGSGSGSAARGDAPTTRGRALPNRRQQLPPPPLPGHGAMPPTTFGLAAPPPPLPQPTPPSFGLSGDFGGLGYASMPVMMPGMSYYIPAMGHHPFSAINNNQHAINAAPVMHGSTSYPTLQHTMQLPTPPPPPPATASSSSVPPSVTRRANSVAAADALPSDDAKHRLRQPTRHVVSSNTMAHSTGRHPINASATAPDDVATPQYLYSLMAAAGALLNSSPELVSHSQPNPSVEQPAQPRLIVVPHPSGSGVCMLPSTVMSYPHSDPQSFAAFGGVAVASSPRHSAASMPGSSDSGLRSPQPTPTTTASNGAAAAQFPPPDFVAATPAPATVVQLPLNSTSHGQSGSGSCSSKVIGDSLRGPAEGTMNPLTSSLASHSGATTSSTEEHGSSAGDYNAILSGLGIGGSSYTTIPLDRLMRQCSASINEDDFVGGDFDWAGAVERWLQTAREDGVAAETATANADDTPTTATAAVATAEKTTASTPGATLAAAKNVETVAETYHLQSARSVMAALNSNPVLVDMGIQSTEANASLPAPASSATEAKRRPIAAVCQVSRAAGGKPSQPQRRAPVTTNQFKSSCAAEADSGAVLLYCAEKNTFVYIHSGGSGAAVAVTPGRRRGHAAAAAATTTDWVALPQSEKWSATTVKAVPTLGRSQDSLNTPCSDGSLGMDVRFVPGRKKRSVLEEVTEEEAEYCI